MVNARFTWLIITLLAPATDGVWSYQPNQVVEYSTTCSKDSMDILLTMDSAFKGVVFAKDYPDACQANGITLLN